MIKVKVTGVKELRTALKDFETGKVLERPITRAANLFRNALGEYPPYGYRVDVSGSAVQALKTKAGSAYKRTGRLGAGWKFRVINNRGNYTVEYSNAVRYAKYVVDPTAQSMIHKGYWRTTTETMRKALPVVEKELTNAVNLAAAKI